MAPNYDAWNAALIELATCGIRRGSPVYLSIDERALLVAWRQFLNQPGGEATTVRQAFVTSVRNHCFVAYTGDLHFDRLCGRDASRRPRGVGFLAALVLAAYDMEDEEEASEKNYYYRLRRVFDPQSAAHGQPDWLTSRYKERLDELLWEEWNAWLSDHGWEPTATQGSVNNKYVHYPICQSILRKGDCARLMTLYRDRLKESAQRSWDRDLFAAHLPELADHASSARLRNLLSDRDSDPRRFEAVADAAFEVYAAMDWSKGEAAADSLQRLEAGVFRTEDRRGNATYFLYPRLPQRWRARFGLEVLGRSGAPEPLVPDSQHAGRFLPLSFPLDNLDEQRFRVTAGGADEGMELVLPGRDFWILIRDPDDEYSDALATWGLPALGEPFLLLCQPCHESQLRALRDLGLLAWEGDHLDPTIGGVPWREYHGCQVLRPRWDHVVPRWESRALVETLRPRMGRLTISLEGGLSVPGQNVWLEGHPPKMRVRTVDQAFRWGIRRRGDATRIHAETEGQTHQLIDLPDLPRGEYDIEVRTDSGVTGRRILRVAAWDGLEAVAPARGHAVEGKHLHFTLRGAHLLPGEV
jgi:hypothetical protein